MSAICTSDLNPQHPPRPAAAPRKSGLFGTPAAGFTAGPHLAPLTTKATEQAAATAHPVKTEATPAK